MTTSSPSETFGNMPTREWLASLAAAKGDACDMCGSTEGERVCLGAASSYCSLCAARIKGYDEGEIETYGVIVQAALDLIYDHVSDSVPYAHLGAAAERAAERFVAQRRLMADYDREES